MLRSIRYGEADRVLHLYTADRGRVGAVAKGVRRVKSRLGGRLEPLSRVGLVLHRGPGGAVHDQPGRHRARPSRAARAARVARARHPGLRGGAPPARLRRAQPARLQPALATSWRCSTPSPGGPAAPKRLPSGSSCCWPRASLPSSPRAPSCGERRASRRLLAAARAGWCAPAARRARSLSTRRRTASSSRRWPGRCRSAAGSGPGALGQADRAIAETLEYHAHVSLRRVA